VLKSAEFDREFIADAFDVPDTTARTKWMKAKRKPSRPRGDNGGKVISVSLEKALLAEMDQLARRKHVSRASLIVRGLRAILKAEDRR